MKKQLVIIGIVAILVCVGLSGCNQISNTINPEKSKFVGTWQDTTFISYDIFSDGTFTNAFGQGGTWDIKDDKLVMYYSETTYSYSYIFSNNDRTVTLKMLGVIGEPLVWIKQ
jgi:hypothetical protein